MDRKILEIDLTSARIEERNEEFPSSLFAFEEEIIESHSDKAVFVFSKSILRANYINPRNNNRTTETIDCAFADRVSQRGISAIIIGGYANKLSFLDISRGRVDIHLCEQLRYCSPHIFKRTLSEDSLDSCLSIGKAGELKSPLACCVIDSSITFGHGALGAVLGSMNLKGIMVRANEEKKGAKLKKKKKSTLLDRLEQEGELTLVNEAFLNGWAPVKYFSGKKDPRVLHLSSAAFKRAVEKDAPIPDLFSALNLGSNLGFFNPVKVQALFEGCLALGLDPAGSGYCLANIKYRQQLEYPLPDLFNAEVVDLLLILDSASERRGIGEIINNIAIEVVGEHSFLPLCDLRGSQMMALSYALDDPYPMSADLITGLSRKYSVKNIALVYAYLRFFVLYQIDNGVSPQPGLASISEYLFKRIPNNALLLRFALNKFCLKNMKDKAKREAVLAKLAKENFKDLPKMFTTRIGENDYTDEIKEKELSVAYLGEVDIITNRYAKKSK
ncbi:MAG: hypothetical protein K6G51_06580 [Sphaerochaetaceae bacterium]|nr:hypothetical protein [Sphaerochaetaceae bacterium]